MKSILSSTKHLIKVGDKLYFECPSFPYPPFGYHHLVYHDDRIIIEDDPQNRINMMNAREGGQISKIKYFKFPSEGIHRVYIRKLSGEGNFKKEILKDDIRIEIEVRN
jgi:hypothetical protein